MNNENITNDVIDVICEVLDIEADEVTTSSKLVIDFGADSLDIVDLSFSLGKKFGIKMPQKTIIAVAEEVLGDLSHVIQNGQLTSLGAELLKSGPNGYSADEAYEGQSLETIFFETTVNHWINLCSEIISRKISGDELINQSVRSVIDSYQMHQAV